MTPLYSYMNKQLSLEFSQLPNHEEKKELIKQEIRVDFF